MKFATDGAQMNTVMRSVLQLLFYVCLSVPHLWQISPSLAQPILGDMDNEIRDARGRFDVQANADALTSLGANTYFYLIWHDKNCLLYTSPSPRD
mgnify:CR=1 FL=1